MTVVATDDFAGFSQGLASPYRHAAAITKSDSDELTNVTRAIYVGGTGDINLVTAEGETVLFKAVPVGLLIICAKKVLSTNTSATDMIALW